MTVHALRFQQARRLLPGSVGCVLMTLLDIEAPVRQWPKRADQASQARPQIVVRQCVPHLPGETNLARHPAKFLAVLDAFGKYRMAELVNQNARYLDRVLVGANDDLKRPIVGG